MPVFQFDADYFILAQTVVKLLSLELVVLKKTAGACNAII